MFTDQVLARPPGGGAVDPRSTSVGACITCMGRSGGWPRCSARRNRQSLAAVAMSSTGRPIVVKPLPHHRWAGASEKPMNESSSGMRTPSSRAQACAPAEMRAPAVTTPVGRFARERMRRMAAWPNSASQPSTSVTALAASSPCSASARRKPLGHGSVRPACDRPCELNRGWCRARLPG